MSRIEHDCHLRSFGSTTEIDDGFAHVLRCCVLDLRDLEIESLQSAPNVLGVARRVEELRYLFVGPVADDERDPGLGRRWLREEPNGCDAEGECPDGTR